MGQLEYLSGFDLGSELKKAYNSGKNLELALGIKYNHYRTKWMTLFTNADFIKGLKIGIGFDIPELTDELLIWFTTL